MRDTANRLRPDGDPDDRAPLNGQSSILNSQFSPGAPGLNSAPLLAARFLFPCDDRHLPDHSNWRTAGRWFVLWGLVIGVVYAVVFRAAWRWFGEYQYIRWVPAAAVLAVDLGLCGYRLLAATADVAGRRYTSELRTAPVVTFPGLVVVVLVAIVKYAMLVSLPLGRLEPGVTEGTGAAGGAWLAYLYPQAVYRPLILMPLWGRWGMTLALSIGRAAPGASDRLTSMVRGARLSVPLGLWPAVWALTTWYCSPGLPHIAHGLAMGLGVMTVAYLGSFVLARRAGGQNEATVGTVGAICELAFLALYLPIASSIYWY